MKSKTIPALLRRSALPLALSAVLSGCLFSNDDDKKPIDATAALGDVLVFTSNYESGELRWFQTGDSIYDANDTDSLYHDTHLRNAGDGFIFALERFGADNLVRLDPTSTTRPIVYQIALDSNANPQDVVITSTATAFISLENTDYLLQFNPIDGSEISRLDLSAYAYTGNTTPNAGGMVLAQGSIHLLLQRRDGWTAVQPGLLAVIDPVESAVTDTINLLFANPHSAVLFGNRLLVSGAGSLPWDGAVQPDSTRGIVEIDLTTGDTRILVSDHELGGSPQDIALDPEGTLWVSVFRSFGDQVVRPVNLSTGSVGNILSGVADASGGLVFDPIAEVLYIGDRVFGSAGVRVWNGSRLRTVSAPDALAPYSIALP